MISIVFKIKQRFYIDNSPKKVLDAIEYMSLNSENSETKILSKSNEFLFHKKSDSTKPGSHGYFISGNLRNSSSGSEITIKYRLEKLYLVYMISVLPLFLLSVFRLKTDSVELVVGYFFMSVFIDIVLYVIQKKMFNTDYIDFRNNLDDVLKINYY